MKKQTAKLGAISRSTMFVAALMALASPAPAPAAAAAQGIHYVKEFTTQVDHFSSHGTVLGCGVYFDGISEAADQTVTAMVAIARIDQEKFIGTVTFSAQAIFLGADNTLVRTPIAMRDGRIRARNGAEVHPMTAIRQNDDKRITYRIKAEDAMTLLAAAAKRDHFLIAVVHHVPADDDFADLGFVPDPVIFSGPVQLAERDLEQLATCMEELAK